MRLFLIFALVSSFAGVSHANEATDALGISPLFPGKYKLLKISGPGKASAYECREEMDLIATADYVSFGTTTFLKSDAGCERTEGDIGPVRFNCTNFSENKISETMTEPVTIVGYGRQYKGIRLGYLNKDLLILESDLTQVPFGILGIWNDEKFKCTYERIKQ